MQFANYGVIARISLPAITHSEEPYPKNPSELANEVYFTAGPDQSDLVSAAIPNSSCVESCATDLHLWIVKARINWP